MINVLVIHAKAEGWARLILLFALLGSACSSNGDHSEPAAWDSVSFEYDEVSGIGFEKDVSRRDPSDVIREGDQYYIWYTRIPATTDGKKTALYNSGYYGTIWYATSTDGYAWTEKGMALGPGKRGTFDSHAVFTPNILKYGGKYYLYFTGVRPTPGHGDNAFANNSETDITAIGIAVSDHPDGPFERLGDAPILTIGDEEAEFDSYRIDDAALVIRDNAIWMYYKGRSRIHGQSGPGKTQMGVAFAAKPEGPYSKYERPLVDKTHEVLIWNQNGGIASLGSLSRSISLASDGLNFSPVQEELVQLPHAPGLFRPHLTDASTKQLPGWGIAHSVRDGDVYLVRFEMRSENK